MKTMLTAVGLTIAALAPWPAMARSEVSVSIGLGIPAPIYVAPAPVYYAPPPPPPRYYYAPRPVVVYSPYYEQRVVYRDYGKRHKQRGDHYYHDDGQRYQHGRHHH